MRCSDHFRKPKMGPCDRLVDSAFTCDITKSSHVNKRSPLKGTTNNPRTSTSEPHLHPSSSPLPRPIWLPLRSIQYDRSYSRSAVTKAQVTAGFARAGSLDGLPNPGKSSWSLSRSTNITTDVWEVDDMADLLYDSDRPLSPQKHRQAPRTGRYFSCPFLCLCG